MNNDGSFDPRPLKDCHGVNRTPQRWRERVEEVNLKQNKSFLHRQKQAWCVILFPAAGL